jgi:acyl-CoA thioester hydrolase
MPAMTRVPAYRLVISNYPFRTSIQTRHADLDLNAHVNNVAMATLFEEGRVRLLNQVREGEGRDQFRGMIVSAFFNYLAQSYYGSDIEMGLGIAKIGNSSWTVHAAAFQHGAAVSTCESVAVRTENGAAKPLGEEWRARFARFLMQVSD